MSRTLSCSTTIPQQQKDQSSQIPLYLKPFLLLFVLIFSLLFNLSAHADFKVYLENRLGPDKNINDFYASLMTTQGLDVLDNTSNVTLSPFEDNLLLASKINSTTLTLVDRSLTYSYSCTSGGFDCWPTQTHPMSIPLAPLYCNLIGNYSIDTSDKTFGSGPSAVTYITRYIKFTFNDDFTISYSIVRKSSDGFIAYERYNLSMEIGRSRCEWAL